MSAIVTSHASARCQNWIVDRTAGLSCILRMTGESTVRRRAMRIAAMELGARKKSQAKATL